jgi:hypothetical protein
MGADRFFKTALFVAMAGLFCMGLVMLTMARFESGNIYPPHSTYLREPAGARALYEALDSLPGIEAQRNTKATLYDAHSPGKTIFVIGLSGAAFSRVDEDSYKDLEKCLQKGERLVIAFSSGAPATDKTKDSAPIQPKDIARDLRTQWGVEFDTTGFTDAGASETKARLKSGGLALPESIDWPGKSTVAFAPKAVGWNTIYTHQDKAVVVEKAFGRGSVVLVADSFLFTNEAMKKHRLPELLTWLCGPNRIMVFDEAHLGIMGEPNVAAIIKRNGLTGLFISVVSLGLLVIWRQLVPFAVCAKAAASVISDTGRGYSQGVANLLRRNLTKDQILHSCVDEWERAFVHASEEASIVAEKARRIIEDDSAVHRRTWDIKKTYENIGALVRKAKISKRKGPL